MRRHVITALLAALALALAFVAPAHASTVQEAFEALESWQLEEARGHIEALVAANPTDPEVVFLQGQLAFYDGDYATASKLMEQARVNASGRAAEHYAATRELVDATAEVTRDHVTVTSPDGRFQLRYPRGKDEVLIPFVFEAMAVAYDALSEDFGVAPPTPVRIEVYGSAADLARVSTLTEDDIRTTGTIALCKYNRIMITSPRVLIRGYGWVDTLVHEFVHMVINQASRDRVPIWLHEGIAKFSERRWRGGDEYRRLTPYAEWLLHDRATKGKIVTFAQMHPSMAKLPSAEDASMAYAEVYAAVELIYAEQGMAGVREVVQRIGRGEEVEDAIAAVVGTSFPKFLSKWEAYLTTRTRRYTGSKPPDIFEQVAFRKGASVDDPDDTKLIEEEEARRYVHLGDLLATQERPRAAVVEYRRASKLLGDGNPVLQTRLGRALIDIGELDEAIEAMQSAIADGETYVTLYVLLGEALVRAERWNEAYEMLREAAALNPFDPSVHQNLAKVYRQQGMTARAELAETHAKLVVRPAEPKAAAPSPP